MDLLKQENVQIYNKDTDWEEAIRISVKPLEDGGFVTPAYKEEIEKTLTEKYLEQFPEYEKTFQVFWVKPDDGARFLPPIEL